MNDIEYGKICNNDPTISIVVPVYNEIGLITKFVDELLKIISSTGVICEIIIVDDGSTDGTWEDIRNLSVDSEKIKIKALSFSRNFGKESAILAGLAYSRGEAVITIDSDLQHPPEKIMEFIQKWANGGAKIVEGVKLNRGKENALHSLFSKIFYRAMSVAVGNDMSHTSDYKLIDREVVDVLLRMPEKQMFYRAITSWVGFKTDTVQYEVQKRPSGKSKWSNRKLFLYAIRNITSFSTAPLQLITVFSVFFIALGIIEGVLAIIKWLDGTAVEGFTTVILLQLISGGLIMFALGLIGYYLAKLIDQAKDRPRYIVEKEIEGLPEKEYERNSSSDA